MMIRRRKPLLVTLAIVLGLVAVYALVGFLIVPSVARHQIISRATAALDREVTLESVSFNPFTFAATLRGLKIAGHEIDELASSQEIAVNFNPVGSLFAWRWSFGDVRLVDPRVHLQIRPDGTLNIADLFSSPPPQQEEEKPPPSLAVERLEVRSGRVTLVDQSRATAFTATIAPLGFTLTDFATAADESGAYHLEGATERGETFSWDGTLQVAPFRSQGALKFHHVDVSAYEPFLAGFFRGDVQTGRASVSGSYSLSFGRDRHVTFRDTNLTLQDLAIALPEGETPVIELPRFDMQITQADVFARAATVAGIEFEGLVVRAERQADGGFNLAALFPAGAGKRTSPTEPPESTAENTTSPAPPNVTIESITLRDGTAHFVDRTTPEPVDVRANAISLTLRDATANLAQAIPMELSLTWQDGPGTLAASGTVQPQPLRTELQVQASELELAALGPYLRTFSQIQVESGRLSAEGRLVSATPPDAPAEVNWSGQLTLRDVATRDARHDTRLLGWRELNTGPAEISLAPLRFNFQQVTWREPEFHLVRQSDGTLNLMTALAQDSGGREQRGTAPGDEGSSAPAGKQAFENTPAAAASDATTPSEGDAAGTPLEFSLAKFAITAGSMTYRDDAMDPAVSTTIADFGGSITGVSSAPDAIAQVDLRGKVGGSAPISITGSINLAADRAPRPSDLALDLGNLELEIFEPYATRYLGYRIASGFARADLNYELSQNNLSGRNHVVLGDLNLGEKVESPDALNVPIQLAISVLRNRAGQIEFTVPVSGDLGSPQFDFASVIADAFGGILVRAATAPFSVLSSLFGGDEKQLQQVDFAGGRADLGEKQQPQLDTLAQILRDRPGLALTIHWVATPAADEPVLRRERLQELLDKQKSRLASAASDEGTGSRATDTTGATATDAAGSEEAAALRALYIERFPAAVPTGATGTDAARTNDERESVDTAGEDESRSLLGRIWHGLFGERDEADDDASHSEAAAKKDDSASATTVPAETLPAPEAMRRQLLDTITIDATAMTDLARSRAEQVQQQLVDRGINDERVSVAPEPGAPEGSKAAPDVARVYFSLAAAEPSGPPPSDGSP